MLRCRVRAEASSDEGTAVNHLPEVGRRGPLQCQAGQVHGGVRQQVEDRDQPCHGIQLAREHHALKHKPSTPTVKGLNLYSVVLTWGHSKRFYNMHPFTHTHRRRCQPMQGDRWSGAVRVRHLALGGAGQGIELATFCLPVKTTLPPEPHAAPNHLSPYFTICQQSLTNQSNHGYFVWSKAHRRVGVDG